MCVCIKEERNILLANGYGRTLYFNHKKILPMGYYYFIYNMLDKKTLKILSHTFIYLYCIHKHKYKISFRFTETR